MGPLNALYNPCPSRSMPKTKEFFKVFAYTAHALRQYRVLTREYPRFWPIERPAHVHPYTPTSRTHYPRIHAPEYTKRGYVRGFPYGAGSTFPYRPEEMIIRYGPPKRLKYLMLGRGWEDRIVL